MRIFRSVLLTVGLLVLALPSFAQTSLNSTTLAAAVATGATQIQVATVANIAVGNYVAVTSAYGVREVMIVRAIASPFLTVTREAVPISEIRRARVHASGATVYTGVPARFYSAEVNGSCTPAATGFTPHITLPSGNISVCSPALVWYRLDQQFTVSCRMLLIADMVDQSCYTVDRNLVLVGATYVSKVVESAGTLTVRIMRQQSTEAAASGDLLATALSGVSTVAETVTPYVLSTTSAFLLLSANERLGVDFTDDAAGELAGVTITFTLAPR